MTLTQVWGAILIFTVCPLLGGLPLIAWLTYPLRRRKLRENAAKNITVSDPGNSEGSLTAIFAILLEALKGIAAVLLARKFFPADPEWELISLIALVMGRYWIAKKAGITSAVWGFAVHDWIAAGFVFFIGGISLTILRERKLGQTGFLILMPLTIALLHLEDGARITAAVALSALLYWIYQKIPEPQRSAARRKTTARELFLFFRSDRAIISLDRPRSPSTVGRKAAILSTLKRAGYPVPPGWVLPSGDDPQALIDFLKPSQSSPLAVHSSNLAEDAEIASAAGQYASIFNVTSPEALHQAINYCLESYFRPVGEQYRRDRQLPEASMAVLIQPYIRGVFSGIAFSRDPIERSGEAVVIEALSGDIAPIVSGTATPELYRVYLNINDVGPVPSGVVPKTAGLEIDGSGNLPPELLEEVALLARQLENRYQGIPQDIQWTYDGEKLWLLQVRAIATMLPIWTRQIAAEVIPGIVRPLTWAIARPLTCNVWQNLFTLLLGKKQARHLDFQAAAALHYSRAYCNVSELGQTFQRLGLPPKSWETFLTPVALIRSAFPKPALAALRNLPGLLRLLHRELSLAIDFDRTYRFRFAPALAELAEESNLESNLESDLESNHLLGLRPKALLKRIDFILEQLEDCTYYYILSPLSLALRKELLGVTDEELDYSQMPEVAAARSLLELAAATRLLLPDPNELLSGDRSQDYSELFATLAEIPDCQSLFEEFEQLLDRYGYLSEVATDIALPTWKEDPRHLRELFAEMLFHPPAAPSSPPKFQRLKAQIVQNRVSLQSRVCETYRKLLGELRWSFVALENIWLNMGALSGAGDIFFLELEEIRQLVAVDIDLVSQLPLDDLHQLIAERRAKLELDSKVTSVPPIIYGEAVNIYPQSQLSLSRSQVEGIGASPGIAVGRVKIIANWSYAREISRETILVVPYTDARWIPALAEAAGVISEVGGQLSYGAIVAREYGIPAVMNIPEATRWLRDGQRVRIDGRQGTVEVLE